LLCGRGKVGRGFADVIEGVPKVVTAGLPPGTDNGTTYLSVVDKDGNMVSLIQSNYSSVGFGAGLAVGGAGFALQNRGGLFSLDRAKLQWSHVPTPMDERSKITALAFSPHSPDVILAGTQFAAMFRSEDHGRTWRMLDLKIPEICSNKNQSRFTQIVFDSVDPRLAWAGVELDYVWRSIDGGVTWRKISQGISEDIHGLAVKSNGSRRVFAATDLGFYFSDDDGENWRKGTVDSPSHYMRAVAPRADHSGVVFLTNGDGPPGSWGRLMRSRDNGEHWEQVALPGQIDSTMWSVATNPADPKLLFASSCLGQLYRSTDGGETWTGLKRRLGEIRHVIWLPS
jgi:photosystem II stability/assembly factor-like uncharacterized protein